MLCERCKKREAVIRYTEIVNGVSSEHNLCLACAREMDFGPMSAFLEDLPLGWLLSGLLGITSEETDEETDAGQGAGTRRFEVTCPTCHTTYSSFVKTSRFGCPDCYGVFDLFIGDNLKRIHGADRHLGKKPRMQAAAGMGTPEGAGTDSLQGGAAGTGDAPTDGKAAGSRAAGIGNGRRAGWPAEPARPVEEQIRILRSKLKEAVQDEEYETAARLRDELRSLEGGAGK